MAFLPGVPNVGQLYLGEYRNGLKLWSQPGGVGTIVFPQQTKGQRSALYALGCGHWLNNLEVFEDYDPYNEIQIAVICCSACSYIQRIMPYEQYQSQTLTPLLVV